MTQLLFTVIHNGRNNLNLISLAAIKYYSSSSYLQNITFRSGDELNQQNVSDPIERGTIHNVLSSEILFTHRANEIFISGKSTVY